MWLEPVLGEDLPFMGFVATSMVACWYGGVFMGFLALGLGLLLGDLYFTGATGQLRITNSMELVHFIRYVVTASLGVVLLGMQRRGMTKTQAAVEALQREIAHRQQTEEHLQAAKDELSCYAAELENRVAERTIKLQESLQSLQDVLYHVAHDLRAPLRAMQGFSALLTSQYSAQLDAQAKDYFQRIAQSATHMDGLIHDLLEYGRLGHSETGLGPVPLNEAVARVLQQLSGEIKRTGAAITVEKNLPVVRANAAMLEKALLNLLENALKFVAPGVTPAIRIWGKRNASTVRLWIQDNGIGIDPQYQKRIFQIFERLHSNEHYPGTGIGLAIVAKGMQMMGGKVGLESEPGQDGSRFWLEFSN